MRKDMILVSAFAVVLSVSPCFGQDHSAPSYKILHQEQRSGLHLEISIDRWIWKQEDVERLICVFFQRERRVDPDLISISIYFDLDRYEPPEDDTARATIYFAHQIGLYMWNQKFAGLNISKGARAVPLKAEPKWVPFNHLKDCDKYRETKPR